MEPRREIRARSGAVDREFAISETPDNVEILLNFSLPPVKTEKRLPSGTNRAIILPNRNEIERFRMIKKGLHFSGRFDVLNNNPRQYIEQNSLKDVYCNHHVYRN